MEFAIALDLTPRLYQVTPEEGARPTEDVADTAYVARLARKFSRPEVTVDFDVSRAAPAADVLVELSRDDEVAMMAMTPGVRCAGWRRRARCSECGVTPPARSWWRPAASRFPRYAWASASSTTVSTASPYRSSLAGPTPLMRARAWRSGGRASAMASKVESSNTV